MHLTYIEPIPEALQMPCNTLDCGFSVKKDEKEIHISFLISSFTHMLNVFFTLVI